MTDVHVSAHAIDRTLERDRASFPGSRVDVALRIRREIEEAIAAGRRAKTKPRWATPGPDRPKALIHPKADRTARFVWNAEETRCYVVETRKTGPAASVVVVKTMLAPPDDERIERAHLKAAP